MWSGAGLDRGGRAGMNNRRRTQMRYERKWFKRYLIRQMLNTGDVFTDVKPKEAIEMRDWFQRCGIPSRYEKKERRLIIL